MRSHLTIRAEIERKCRSIDPDVREAMIAEMEAHLDASIQARIELGSTLDEAETDALREFGRVEKVSRALNRVHAEPAIHRGYLATVSAAVFAYMLCFAWDLGNWPGILFIERVVFTPVAFISIAAVFAASYYARKIQWKSWLVLLPVICIWTAIALSQGAVHLPGEDTDTPYKRLAAQTAAIRKGSETVISAVHKVDEIYARYEKGENIAVQRIDLGVVRTKMFENRADAAKRWKYARAYYWQIANEQAARAERYTGVRREMWWQDIPWNLTQSPVLASQIFLFVVGISLIGSAFRWLIDSLKRAVSARNRLAKK